MDKTVLLDANIDECSEFCNICYNPWNDHSLHQVFHIVNIGETKRFYF